MPEIPDLTLYQDAIESRLVGQSLTGMRIASPFVLRTAEPPTHAFIGKQLEATRRIGKRIVLCFEDEHFAVIHLMIAGRFKWFAAGKKLPGKLGLMAFDFQNGTLVLTEASQKHRAGVYLVAGKDNLQKFDAGGLEVMTASLEDFTSALTRENHTIKRSMTDQKILAGIGNAYSDEILHRARISPMRQVRHFDEPQFAALFEATRNVLEEWTDRLRQKSAGKFPDKVTAFHEEMAVHGKYKQPCPDCGHPVQRIRYASNECNYCASCQNQGNLLADRSLSRLLKQDWPKKLEDLES